MAERQRHGLDFEDWVRETFTTNEKASPTSKWDIVVPNYRDEFKSQTSMYAGKPVSIKTCQGRSAINFGDALRQYENTEEFLLIVGFYTKAGNGKNFFEVSVSLITPVQWHSLFAEVVTPEELDKDRLTAEETGPLIVKFDELVSDRKPHYAALRKSAKEAKKQLPRMEISLNQKIGSDRPGKPMQRRLQCSLSFLTFWSKFGVKGQVYSDGKPRLWGVEVPSF